MAAIQSGIQLKDFEANDTPVPTDIVYCGDSSDAYNEVKSTIADIIAAYPALLSIGSLTTLSGQLLYTTGVDTYASLTMGTGVASALAANVIGTGSIGLMGTGTFTPVFTSSGGGTATYASRTGTYTRIGDRLFFDIVMTLSGLPSAGNVSITGLPVACIESAACSVFAQNLDSSVVIPLIANVPASISSVTLWVMGSGTPVLLTVAQCVSNSVFVISGCYKVT